MTKTYNNHLIYYFGEFALDVDRGALTRNGDEIRLRPKAFDVLRYLVEHPGRLVSRNELLDAVWKGSVVTDDSVTQCLIDIRRALADSDQDFIRTVPRRGFVFEEVVNRSAEAPGDTGLKQSIPGLSKRIATVLIGAAVIVLAIAVYWYPPGGDPVYRADGELPVPVVSEPAIAVLPFTVLSDDSEQTHFADGVSEEILNLLARQRGLRVIARTSSFSFRDRNVDVDTIADRLGVSHILEGSLRNDGDHIRVNVQLVEATSGEYLWTERFDRALSASSLFDIQSEIATTVLNALRAELSDDERNSLARMPTGNLDALNAYFSGRQQMETRRPTELVRAQERFEEAISLDPDFALAYVALADTYRLRANYGSLSDRVADDRGQVAVDRALELNPYLGEAYATLGNLQAKHGRYEEAESSYQRAIELNPNYAPSYQWYGEFLSERVFLPEKSIEISRMSVALDPRSAIINLDYGKRLAGAGRKEDALAQVRAVAAIDPEFEAARYHEAWLLHRAFGRVAESLPIYERSAALSTSMRTDTAIALACIDLAEDELARRYLRRALELAPGHAYPLTALLYLQVLAGDHAAARVSATRILGQWPEHPPTLRYLRDQHVAASEPDLALALYDTPYPQLLSEDGPLVDESNFEAAIDLAYLLQTTGRTDRAVELLERGRREFSGRPRYGAAGIGIADVRVHALLGDNDAALDALETALADGWIHRWRYELGHDHALAALRGTAGFRALYARIEAEAASQRQQRREATGQLSAIVGN